MILKYKINKYIIRIKKNNLYYIIVKKIILIVSYKYKRD